MSLGVYNIIQDMLKTLCFNSDEEFCYQEYARLRDVAAEMYEQSEERKEK